MSKVTFLSQINGRIDDKAGVIRGVSVITEGEARGHDLKIDSKTVEQMLDACAASNSGRVKTKLNHRSGIESVFGYLSEFRIQGPKLVADLYLLKKHKDYDQTLEQIREMPESIGLSVAFTGQPEVGSDGRKIARVERIVSADLVAEPAANPTGLFEEPLISEEVDTQNKNETMNDIDKVLQAIGALNERLDTYDQRFDNIEQSIQGDEENEDISEEEIAEAIENLREQGYDDEEIEAIISSELDEFYGEGEGEEEEEEEDDSNFRNGGTDLDPENRVSTVAAQAGAAQPYGEEGDELSRIESIVTHLESKLAARESAEQEQALAYAFGEVRDKITMLAVQNDELQAELAATRHALQTGAGMAVGNGGSAQDITLSAGPFEDIVRFHVGSGKSKSEAIGLAARENKVEHLDWLRRNGVIQ